MGARGCRALLILCEFSTKQLPQRSSVFESLVCEDERPSQPAILRCSLPHQRSPNPRSHAAEPAERGLYVRLRIATEAVSPRELSNTRGREVLSVEGGGAGRDIWKRELGLRRAVEKDAHNYSHRGAGQGIGGRGSGEQKGKTRVGARGEAKNAFARHRRSKRSLLTLRSTQAITEISGPPSSGKTQLCMQLAVDASLPPSVGGASGTTIWVDAGGGLCVERLAKISQVS